MYTKIDENELFERLNSLDYNTLFKHALQESYGFKTLLNGAWFIYFIIAIILTAVLHSFGVNQNLSSFILLPIVLPLAIGVMMLGVYKVRQQEVQVSSIFNYYIYVWQLFFAYFLVSIFTGIGFLLLVLPGIYFMVAYMFTQPLIVDKGLSFWDAMELSRKVISKRWFFFFGYIMIISLMFIASVFTLGIALIWALPIYTLSYAMIYDFIFSTLDDEGNEN